MIVLREALNTRYINNSMSGKMRIVLNEAMDSGDTVDFAGCRLGPESALALNEYYGKVVMVNSEEPLLHKALENNFIVKTEVLEAYEEFPIKSEINLKETFDLISNLPRNAKLMPKWSSVSNKPVYATILLMMARPDIDWDIRNVSKQVFSYIRNQWCSFAEPHDAYWELNAPNTVSRYRHPETGKFGDDLDGWMTESIFVRRRTVIPREFSTVTLFGPDKEIPAEWVQVVKECISKLKDPVVPVRKKGKTIRHFVDLRKDI